MGVQQVCVACVCLKGVVVSAHPDYLSLMPPLECAMVPCAWPVCPPGEEPLEKITDCCHVCRPIGRLTIGVYKAFHCILHWMFGTVTLLQIH